MAHRLFVAAWPPPAVVERLVAVPRPEVRGVRWVSPADLHVTLRFLGDAEPDDVAARLDSVVWPSAIVGLGPEVVRLGRSTLVVPVQGLDGLAAVVRDSTADLGQAPDERGFVGHLTLARARGWSGRGTVGAPIEATFVVREVVLVASATRHDGPRYHVMRRWPTG
jgi:2'-5' RNA ligase